MVITVQCPSCDTSFPVDTDKVPDAGVHARCSRCEGVFFVEKPEEAAAEEPTGVTLAPSAEAEAEAPSLDAETPAVDKAPEVMPEAEAAPEPESALEVTEPVSEPPAPEEEVLAVGDTGVVTLEAEPETEEPSLSPEGGDGIGTVPPAPADLPESPAAPPAATETPPAPSSFSFGRRDPHEKARRLARVLVSDMIMYNPERHSRALQSGSLKDDFDDEIKKSWQEYVDQVGDEISGSTNYFNDALNEILAKGQEMFS